MNYDDVMLPWRNLPPEATLKFYILEAGEPKPVADQAAHEAWFRSHTEWLIAEQNIKGTKVTTFFFGVDCPQGGDVGLADSEGLLPALWVTLVTFPGAYTSKIITGSTVLEDALCAHGVVVTWLKTSPPAPTGISEQSWAANDLVEAVNDDSDRRYQRGKYTPKPIIPPGTTVIDVSKPPPTEPTSEGISVPPVPPTLDASAQLPKEG